MVELESDIYFNTREHYLENAIEMINRREFRKASELLWGVVSQSVKGLAAIVGIAITGHGQIKQYVLQLSRDLNDKSLYDLFVKLEELHRNFYDERIAEEEIPEYFDDTITFIEKIDNVAKA